MRRVFILQLSLFCFLIQDAGALFAADKPDVLFIAIDDLNDWLGCLRGHPQAYTPHIDQLARRGVLFANAHCAAPACNPSRAAVFSGQRPEQTGIYSNDSPRLLRHRPDLQPLSQWFAQCGYQTYGTGKLLHGGESKKIVQEGFFPEQRWSPFRGEQVSYTPRELPSKGTDNPRHEIKDGPGGQPVILPLNRMPSDRAPERDGGESFDWGSFPVDDDAMGDGQITNWAAQRLREPPSQPMFLAVGFYRPHIPLLAPEKYFQRFDHNTVHLPPVLDDDLDDLSEIGRKWAIEAITAGSHQTVVKYNQWHEAVAAYLACVHFVDTQVGKLLKALESGPRADNTIVVLWSDHGWHLGEKQHWGKWTGWERSTRVPLIIDPGSQIQFSRGGTCQQPVSLLDLYPTLIELCALDPPPHALDGKSLVPRLKNPNRDTNRAVLTTFDEGNHSLRTRDWRFIQYRDGSLELYDLQSDPHEWNNLAGRPEWQSKLAEFQRRLAY